MTHQGPLNHRGLALLHIKYHILSLISYFLKAIKIARRQLRMLR